MAEQPPQKKQKTAEEQAKIPFANGVSDLLKLLNGISHGDKEVFLRELVLNASFALYAMRREALFDCDLIGPRGLFIDIIPDKSNHTLSIVDNGIGMTEDDLKNRLFTDNAVKRHLNFSEITEHTELAPLMRHMTPEPALKRHMKSARLLRNKKLTVDEFYRLNSDFNLGFFSAFMVADNIEITTKHYGDKPPCRLFASASDMSFFFVGGDVSSSLVRGTKVTLQLNKDQFEYLDEGRLKVLIDKYTFDLVPYPVSICNPSGNIIVKRLADVEEKEKDMNKLVRDFENLRKLFVKVLSASQPTFKHAIISDRMYDRSISVSLDRATIEINPRNSLIKKLRQDAMQNPEDKALSYKINGLYMCGLGNVDVYEFKRHPPLIPSAMSRRFG